MKLLSEILRDKKHTRTIYILLAVGIALLLVSRVMPTGEVQSAEEIAPPTQSFDTSLLEARLEEMLSQIKGAGKVRVMVTMEDEGERLLASDCDGGKESTVVLSGGGGESVAAVREKLPAVRGAIAIASGAKNAAVREALTSALCALLDADAHKIKVYEGTVGNDAGT